MQSSSFVGENIGENMESLEDEYDTRSGVKGSTWKKYDEKDEVNIFSYFKPLSNSIFFSYSFYYYK